MLSKGKKFLLIIRHSLWSVLLIFLACCVVFFACFSLFCVKCSGPALSELDQLLPIGSCAEVVYYLLSKYTQQHTAGFTENDWVPPLLNPALQMLLWVVYWGFSLRNYLPFIYKSFK
jgi:hypothetical protein